MVGSIRAAGDLPGHEFHGNQWTTVNAEEKAIAVALGIPSSYSGKDSEKFPEQAVDNPLPKSDALSHKQTKRLPIMIMGESKTVDISSLKSTQDYVQPSAVQYYEKGIYMKSQPIVATIHGDEVLLNGNHNVLAAKIRGEKTISVQHLGDFSAHADYIKKVDADPRFKGLRSAILDPARAARLLLEAARRAQSRSDFGRGVSLADPVPTALAGARRAEELRQLGDLPGHEFHGNQWTSGIGGELSAKFPRAGKEVDGLTVRDGVPNESSIGSSLDSYESLPGVREVQMSDMDPDYQVKPYSTSESNRLDRLEQQIRDNKEISPLIVVIDKEKHPYILEGGHRYDALRRMGVKSFPAKVVIDTESVELRGAARHETPLHTAADAHAPKLAVAFRFAFAKGRKALGKTNVKAAADAVQSALEDVLPPMLLKVIAAGGDVGVAGLLKLRTAELRTAKDTKIKPSLKMRFDGKNDKAIKWAKQHALELAQNIADVSRDRIKAAVARQQETGEDAYDEILAAVGDEDRATLIARHESMVAASEGQRQSWGQAVDKGLLTGDEKRVWITTPDERLCDVCEPLDGETADLDGLYAGEFDGPPAHVACRCAESIVG